ncbi:class 1 fructose-bisphosphatase [Salinibaculum salinum]|uniref:class 1 fructose-bisphosphatase n=1 Tax=Salinibaculum salinum TaxID=3131996 RepID=UPI0030EB77FA
MTDAIETVFETVATTAADVRGALAERRAYADAENPSGEQQLAADVYADELLEERLLALDGVGSYASEERDGVVEADDAGQYHVACDPLDGSSNLQSNNGMGTIVGVFDESLPAPGSALVASGFVLYGPITTMLVARGGTVTEYLLDGEERSVLTEDVAIPDDPVVYGFGGRIPDWTDQFRSYVDDIEADRLKLRYGGAMVADVNQVITYGGIFGYPMLEERPEGKLRLQFEGHPIAHVIETAGGASSNGTQSLLDCDPDGLHERTPVFVGSESLVDRLESALS